jgi:hypothetical protein
MSADFSLWIDQLTEVAKQVHPEGWQMTCRYPLIYLEYFNDGLSPEEAYAKEWE